MRLNICFYEDRAVDAFGPLLFTRPVWELRCGALTLAEKILKQLGQSEVSFRCRYLLRNHYQLKTRWSWLEESSSTDNILFINGRLLINSKAAAELTNNDEEVVYTAEDDVAAFRLRESSISRLRWDEDGIINIGSLNLQHKSELDAKIFRYPWELIQSAANEIEKDLSLVTNSEREDYTSSLPDDVIVRQRHNIDLHSSCQLGAGVVLSAENYPIRLETSSKIGVGAIVDSTGGPIWIAENAEVQAGAIIMGPAYIGPYSIVRPGAKISDGVCVGPHCRVGGEVSSSTLIGYSNKQHSGYLGNAYLGEWINLGAATDNSDLKNNYKPVDVVLKGEKINSESLHVGVFLADFTRTAIHTRLNSGTYIGVGCNIFGANFPEKSVPSFTWHGSQGYQHYFIDKAIETIFVLMSRRSEKLTEELEGLLRQIYTDTQGERDLLIDS